MARTNLLLKSQIKFGQVEDVVVGHLASNNGYRPMHIDKRETYIFTQIQNLFIFITKLNLINFV